MPTTDDLGLGVVNFMPLETYVNPDRGLDLDGQVDSLMEDLSLEGPRSVSDWPRVQVAIRRGPLFVIETSTPSFTAMLRFDPDHPDAGDYEIHPRPRGQIEKGRTTKVTAVASDDTSRRLGMLAPFAVRYAVRTIAETRPLTELIWLVGLRSYRTVDETDVADDERG